MISCQKIKDLLPQYIDGELDAQDRQKVQDHVSACLLCGLSLKQEKGFDSLLRNYVLKTRAPYELREAVIGRIEKTGGSLRGRLAGHWRGFSAAALAGTALVLFVTTVFLEPQNIFPVFSESVETHMELLKGGLPLEIVTEDKKEIMDWFKGKVNFAVHMPDFANPEVKLVGARLSHLKDKKAAYVLLEKNGQRISVFIVDTQGMSIPESKELSMGPKKFYVKNHKGYRSVLCIDNRDGGVGCIFVSDMTEAELLNLIT